MSTARWRAEVIPALHLLLFGLALWALDRLLHDYPLRDITAALRAAVGASIVMLLFAVERLISGTVPRSRTPKGGQGQRRTPPLPEGQGVTLV